MKRRTCLKRIAAPPHPGPTSQIAAREPEGFGADAQATFSTRQHQADAAPIAGIEPHRAALLVIDYQPAWIRTIPECDAKLSRTAGNVIFTLLTIEPGPALRRSIFVL